MTYHAAIETVDRIDDGEATVRADSVGRADRTGGVDADDPLDDGVTVRYRAGVTVR